MSTEGSLFSFSDLAGPVQGRCGCRMLPNGPSVSSASFSFPLTSKYEVLGLSPGSFLICIPLFLDGLSQPLQALNRFYNFWMSVSSLALSPGSRLSGSIAMSAWTSNGHLRFRVVDPWTTLSSLILVFPILVNDVIIPSCSDPRIRKLTLIRPSSSPLFFLIHLFMFINSTNILQCSFC